MTRSLEDDRVRCTDCSNYRRANSHCLAHVRAALSRPDVSRGLAATPQRCPAFAHVRAPPAEHRIHRLLPAA